MTRKIVSGGTLILLLAMLVTIIAGCAKEPQLVDARESAICETTEASRAELAASAVALADVAAQAFPAAVGQVLQASRNLIGEIDAGCSRG